MQGEKIPCACFRALATSGSDASLRALARIGQATSNGTVLKQLAKTLEQVSARRGMSPASPPGAPVPPQVSGALTEIGAAVSVASAGFPAVTAAASELRGAPCRFLLAAWSSSSTQCWSPPGNWAS